MTSVFSDVVVTFLPRQNEVLVVTSLFSDVVTAFLGENFVLELTSFFHDFIVSAILGRNLVLEVKSQPSGAVIITKKVLFPNVCNKNRSWQRSQDIAVLLLHHYSDV